MSLLDRSTRALAAACLASLGAFTWVQAAQSPAPVQSRTSDLATGGTILGRVVDSVGSEPVEGATVSIWASPGDGNQLRVLTDKEGRFIYHAVPPGHYHVVAELAGYMPGAFGRRQPEGVDTLLLVGSGQQADTTLTLWKYGVITGRVTDEAGEPVVGVGVRALQARIGLGGPTRFALQPWPTTFSTDDRGMFRLMVPPGDYVVAATTTVFTTLSGTSADAANPQTRLSAVHLGDLDVQVFDSGARAPAPPPPGRNGFGYVYRPSSAYSGDPGELSTSLIGVEPGREHTGVEIRLQLSPAVSVSGRLLGPTGPLTGTELSLVPAFADDPVSSREFVVARANAGSSGSFTFVGVPAGQYVVQALELPRAAVGSSSIIDIPVNARDSGPGDSAAMGGQTLWAQLPLTVGSEPLTGVTVTAQRGFRIAGRIEFEGTARPPAAAALQRLHVVVTTVDGRFTIPGGRVDERGGFTTPEYPPGKYLLWITEPPGWRLRSATHDGRNLADTPFDLAGPVDDVLATFVDSQPSLSGRVLTLHSVADPDALVVLFPSDYPSTCLAAMNGRREQGVRAGPDGSYLFAAVPAGDYFVAAVDAASVREWRDLATLDLLSRIATRLTVHDADVGLRRDLVAGRLAR